MEKLLSAKQVADYLGMHPKTLYKLVRENRIALNFVQIHGRTIAFRPSEVERYIDLHEVVRTGSAPAPSRKPRQYQPMSDQEAQEFFKNIKRDEYGCLMTTPDESE